MCPRSEYDGLAVSRFQKRRPRRYNKSPTGGASPACPLPSILQRRNADARHRARRKTTSLLWQRAKPSVLVFRFRVAAMGPRTPDTKFCVPRGTIAGFCAKVFLEPRLYPEPH